jgi:hypothetical protein
MNIIIFESGEGTLDVKAIAGDTYLGRKILIVRSLNTVLLIS